MSGTTTADTGTVETRSEGDVATITLRRPAKRNALTPEMLAQLAGCVAGLARSDARVVLVRAEGDRAFCVGADITRFAGLTSVEMLDWTARGHQVLDALAALPQPTVAVLHSHAFGGGLELALACDLRVMTLDATVALPEVGLGTVPGWGGTERLTELVGRARAKDVVLGRRTVDAATALAWGLVSEVATAQTLDTVVDALTARLCAGAPVAVRLAKTIIDAAADGAPARVLEQLAAAVTSATDDLAEGVNAFRTRSDARFTGR